MPRLKLLVGVDSMTITFDSRDDKEITAIYEALFNLMQMRHPELTIKFLVPKNENIKYEDLKNVR